MQGASGELKINVSAPLALAPSSLCWWWPKRDEGTEQYVVTTQKQQRFLSLSESLPYLLRVGSLLLPTSSALYASPEFRPVPNAVAGVLGPLA